MRNAIKRTLNKKVTENGATAYESTLNYNLDLFAFGGAYRSRPEKDIVKLFNDAYHENEEYALKILFYLGDIRGGQGERRFFRVCFRWLATKYPETAKRLLWKIPEYKRWDDLIYSVIDTPIEADGFNIIASQIYLDSNSKTPSLLGKWLPSINTSSYETKRVAKKLKDYLQITSREYRLILSTLRKRINVLEKLMSNNEWDKIEYDKIPSKAGMIYSNAFAVRDGERYKEFLEDKNQSKKMNSATLYPYELIRSAISTKASNITKRLALDTQWSNQKDYLNGEPCKMLCVCDTSGSMTWTPSNNGYKPIDAAIGLSMYCAERVGEPFKNHYISFSRKPQFIQIKGTDFYDKVQRIYDTNLCENTDLKKTFDLLKEASLEVPEKDRLDTVVIISDMEIDRDYESTSSTIKSLMEEIREDWQKSGLICPRLVYWNVAARNNTILDLGENASYCSGNSPSIFQQILKNKNGMELLMETVIDNPRYKDIRVE